MSTALSRYRRILRTALLALLVLGMVISPALGAMGEMHGLEHAAAASTDTAHGHAHSADSGRHGHHEGEGDPDHATGVHGLLHQAASMSVTLPEVALDFLIPVASLPLLPEFARRHLPGDSPTHPFRPPIA